MDNTTEQAEQLTTTALQWSEAVADFAQYSLGVLVALGLFLVFYGAYKMLRLYVTHTRENVPVPKSPILKKAKIVLISSIVLTVIEPAIYFSLFGMKASHDLEIDIVSIVFSLSQMCTFIALLYVLTTAGLKSRHPFTYWHTLVIAGILYLFSILSISVVHAANY